MFADAALANAGCLFWYYQPKVPQGMNKFKNPCMQN
ncbi:MAG TPA: hypothetical protein DEB10_13565 [Ruminococcaceae bacterium]|nr:hypothetical protein [Oscillospiraceae bacterium]HCA29238.1 hypothetical protein [Oscillospiraceae bacterium]